MAEKQSQKGFGVRWRKATDQGNLLAQRQEGNHGRASRREAPAVGTLRPNARLKGMKAVLCKDFAGPDGLVVEEVEPPRPADDVANRARGESACRTHCKLRQ